MCPYKDCKRSTGSGFTRKENLNEHLRRVHRRADDDQPHHPESGRCDVAQSLVDDNDENDDDRDDSLSLGKRKRDLQPNDRVVAPKSRSEDELHEEVLTLRRKLEEVRRESAEKDAKIQYLEAAVKHFAGQVP
jgi:hypothetical protein